MAQIQQPHKEHTQKGKEGRKVGGREEGDRPISLTVAKYYRQEKIPKVLIITVVIQQIHVI